MIMLASDVQALLSRGRDALNSADKQLEASVWLRRLGDKARVQAVVLDAVRRDLVELSDTARLHCAAQDLAFAALSLLGRGRALALLDRQESSLNWLMRRGARAQTFVARKCEHFVSLSEMAQLELARTNRRADAVDYLLTRRSRAEIAVECRRRAVERLMQVGRALWRVADDQGEAQLWLRGRAKRAVTHSKQLAAAQKRLKVRILPTVMV